MLKDFVLWQKTEDFVGYLFPIIERYPKHEKFALCSQIKNVCYEIMRDIIKVNKSRNKAPIFYDIDTSLEFLRWLLRHSHERKYLAHQSYETTGKKVNEIGRIIGGLLKGT